MATSEKCLVCGDKIKVQSFKGSGYCSIKCQKVALGELPKATIDRVAFERAVNEVLTLGSSTHSKLFARGVNFAINELRGRLT